MSGVTVFAVKKIQELVKVGLLILAMLRRVTRYSRNSVSGLILAPFSKLVRFTVISTSIDPACDGSGWFWSLDSSSASSACRSRLRDLRRLHPRCRRQRLVSKRVWSTSAQVSWLMTNRLVVALPTGILQGLCTKLSFKPSDAEILLIQLSADVTQRRPPSSSGRIQPAPRHCRFWTDQPVRNLVLNLDVERPRAVSADPVPVAALLTSLTRVSLRRLRLLVSPDTVLRWHRDLMKRRHAQASWRRRPGRPRTVASVRQLVLRLAADNSSWGYRRIHGELALLGVTVAASTVWEILNAAGVDPAPHRATVTWAEFLRSQAEVVLAMDFVETVTLTGAASNGWRCMNHIDMHTRSVSRTKRLRHLLHRVKLDTTSSGSSGSSRW